ncbi:MAG: hypothetical protein WCG91_02210 [Candidatus Shapirobacteria bacterium]
MPIKPELVKDQLEKYKKTIESRQKYVKNEYQSYGMELAKELGDWKGRAIYMRLAKNVDRKIIEKARYFVKDQDKSRLQTPYKLFMWKLKELRKEQEIVI